MGTSPRAYSYLRFSTPEQSKGDSLRRQTHLALEYCRTHGLELDTELNLRDLGVSAFRGKNVETGALGAFLRAVQDGIVLPGSFLLVESLDRVSRKAANRAVMILQQIVDGGVTVVTLNDGKAYTQESLEGFDFVMAVLMLIRAHEESLTKSKRLKAAWHGKRLQIREKTMTKMTPAWIELDQHRKPVLIEERARIVRRIVNDFLRGVGKPGIAKALNEEGVPTFGRAKYWHWSYMTKVLKSPALVGTFVPHVYDFSDGKRRRLPLEPVADYFPAVIDTDTHERLRSLLTGRAPLRGRHARAPMGNILSGLARCPRCGGTMTRANKGRHRKSNVFFVCARARTGAGCKYESMNYFTVEEALLKEHARIIAEMPHPDAEIEKALQNADAAVSVLGDRLEELMELLERRPSDALAARVAELEADLKDARKERDAVAARAAQAETRVVDLRVKNFGTAMRARPVVRERINAAMRELLTAVVIDGSRLTFRWRAGGESSLLYAWPKAS